MDPGYSSFLDLEEEKSTRGPIVSSSPSDAGSQAGAEDPESDTGGQRLAHLAAKSLAWTGLVLGALMIVSAPDIAINTQDGLGRALVGAGFLVPAAWWFYCERAGRTDRYWPIVTVAALIILGTGASGIEST